MKYRTKLYALSGAAGALTLLIVLGLAFSPSRSQRRTVKAEILTAKSAEKVVSATIEVSGQSLTLRKSGEGWTMEKAGKAFPASAEKVKAFLQALSSSGGAYKVSSKKTSHASFGLEPQTKKIEFYGADGTAIAGLAMGNDETGGKRVYAVLNGKDTVYSLKDVFSNYLRTDDRTWADLRVIPRDIKAEDIQEMTIKAELPGTEGQDAVKADYRVIRDAKKGWTLSSDAAFPLDESKVDLLARHVAGLEGDSFVVEKADEASALMAKPIGTIRFRTGKGEEFSITAAEADSEKRHALRADGSQIMVYTSSWTLRNCMKDLDSLKKAEPVK